MSPSYSGHMGDSTRLTGMQKAAVLLVSLDPDTAASVFRYLSEAEIVTVTKAISEMPHVNADIRNAVIDEFQQLVASGNANQKAGPDYARVLLERSIGSDKAQSIMERVHEQEKGSLLSRARRVPPKQLSELIRNEHPQTIAAILAHLQPDQAGAVLSTLSSDKQLEVARRMTRLDGMAPELLHEIEAVLERKLAPLGADESRATGGAEVVAAVLNHVDRTTEKAILAGLEGISPDLAGEIKKHMLLFEDITHLDPKSMQRLARDVDAKVWALALKAADDELTQYVFQNMSQRLMEQVKEEMSYLGLVRLREVEEAQQRIVAVARALEARGEIVIIRGGEEDLYV
jgi:flagellar motor switch protein FliG